MPYAKIANSTKIADFGDGVQLAATREEFPRIPIDFGEFVKGAWLWGRFVF
jgi:hypothetical protein